MTALVGLHLWGVTTREGREGTGVTTSRLPSSLTFIHPLIGLGGAGVWIAYMTTDSTGLAWLGLGWLVVGAIVGEVLFVRTLRSRRDTVVVGAGPAEPDPRFAENHMPLPAIALHGVLAFALMGLVLAEALTT